MSYTVYIDGIETVIEDSYKPLVDALMTNVKSSLLITKCKEIDDRCVSDDTSANDISVDHASMDILTKIDDMHRLINDTISKEHDRYNDLTNNLKQLKDGLNAEEETHHEYISKYINDIVTSVTDRVIRTDEENRKLSNDIAELKTLIKTININDSSAIDNNTANSINALQTLLNSMLININTITNRTEPGALADSIKTLIEENSSKILVGVDEIIHPKEAEIAQAIGEKGEINMVKTLEDFDINLSVEKVSTSYNQCCDIHVIDNTADSFIAIEVKTYKNPIPRDQIEKFQRDMKFIRESGTFNDGRKIYGMFIGSMRMNKLGKLHIDENGDIYLCEEYANPAIIKLVILWLRHMHLRNVLSGTETTTSDELPLLLNQLTATLNNVNSMRSLIEQNKKFAKNQIANCDKELELLNPFDKLQETFNRLYPDYMINEQCGKTKKTSNATKTAIVKPVKNNAKNKDTGKVPKAKRTSIETVQEYLQPINGAVGLD